MVFTTVPEPSFDYSFGVAVTSIQGGGVAGSYRHPDPSIKPPRLTLEVVQNNQNIKNRVY